MARQLVVAARIAMRRLGVVLRSVGRWSWHRFPRWPRPLVYHVHWCTKCWLIRPSNVARALTGLTTSAGSGPSTVSPAQSLSTTVSAASTVAASSVTAAKSRLRLNEVGVQFMAPIHARLRSATSALAWVNWKAAPPQRTPTPRGQVGVGRRGTARVAPKRMLLQDELHPHAARLGLGKRRQHQRVGQQVDLAVQVGPRTVDEGDERGRAVVGLGDDLRGRPHGHGNSSPWHPPSVR